MGRDGNPNRLVLGSKLPVSSPPALAPSPTGRPIALTGLLPTELAERAGIDLTDARRLLSAVYRTGDLPAVCPAKIRRVALDAVRALGRVPTIDVVEKVASELDPFVKYAFRLEDGATIETVRIPLEHPGRFSVCVSSQVGCAIGCTFCATGKMGLSRNLSTWEIVEQVRRVRAELPEGGRVHGVVFQGMGEPLSNADRVIRAVKILSDPACLAIDRRNITVCTSGLPAAIRRLAREVPGVRLGLSIADARPSQRRTLMPIDEANPLSEVLEAVGEFTAASGYAPMFAYTLIAGVNDGPAAAVALADLASRFAERHGQRPRLSLVPMNPIAGSPFDRPDAAAIDAFRDVLGARGIGSILRYSGGGDVGAACGQLARPGQSRASLDSSSRAG
jgi:23S rRNA (adenine2503-C2)-methyltransferase